ncbi:TPA: DUF2085 domain-containing protein [Candidatus Micrarchaeota archaeon]|nr:DUF2085 domain-containing protein [Candidatus Micrarchaeota archaeon]
MSAKGFWLFIILTAVVTVPIFIVPLLVQSIPQVFSFTHDIYSPTCHQLTSRSLCYFPKNGSFGSFEDCFSSPEFNESKAVSVNKFGTIGYKMPVCSRDVGIYSFMLVGGILFSFVRKKDEVALPPAIWLILALVPLGIDGTGQLLGFWESTNTMRIITGAIAGFVVPFYAIPLLNRFFK